MSKIFNYHW